MPSTSLQDVTKELREAYIALSADFKSQNPGRSLVVTCTARSAEEQLEAYKQGRALRDGVWVVEDISKVVTQLSGQPGHASLHNLKPAQAIDVAVCIGGKVSWDSRDYLPLGSLATTYGLEWGGNWPHLKDYPHLQKASA
jgi:peptidoglycan L-alanyl-D-glutamate endopeptidase CwlK